MEQVNIKEIVDFIKKGDCSFSRDEIYTALTTLNMEGKNIKRREDIQYPDFFFFKLTQFITYDDATSKERKIYKEELETCGGFTRSLYYKTAWKKSWDEASDEDKRKVLQLPNWDNEIFKEISGIDVEKELGITK